MKEFWEITHDRGVDTQAVWGMQPDFAINKLNKTQHAALTDSLPTLAEARDAAENNLTTSISAKETTFRKLKDVAVRLPGILDGTLEDDDELKDQLDAIYAIEPNISEAHVLRRCRLLMPFWEDVDEARANASPPLAVMTIKYQGEELNQGAFASAVALSIAQQKDEAEKQRLVTNAKSALRTADRKTDRGNKRWYKSWMNTYPIGTDEGDAAQEQIETEQGVAAPTALEILEVSAVADHSAHLDLDPAGGNHATTKELQYKLPGETEFGHTTPITGNTMNAGPFTVGATVTFRTRVSNSHPGSVTSEPKSVVIV